MANETGRSEAHDPISTYTALGLYGVLDITIIAANSLVLFLVYKKRHLRTVTNNFLVSLAVSDLSTGLVAIPSAIACSLILDKYACITMDICVRFLAFSSVTHLTVLTLERYIRITKPFVYRSRVTGTRTYRVIAGMWGFSLVASLLQLSWILNSSIEEDDENPIAIVIYDNVSFVLVVVIPLFLISGLYIAMFRFIRSHNARRGEVLAMSTNKADVKRAKAKSEKKLLLVFLVMIVVFILGSFTYFFWTILVDLYEDGIGFTTYRNMVIVSMFFRYFSSLCNPLLLTFFKQDFYEALVSVMGRRRETAREKRLMNEEGRSVTRGKTASDEL